MSKTKLNQKNFIYRIINKDLNTGKCITVRTRFPPEPNGYLHIGHAKSICLNFGIAKNYNGECNLRFDDTNPVKESIEYINSIINDIKWLGFNCLDKITYSSNYFDQLYSYAIELINKGLAYVDELTSEQIREYRGNLISPGKNSPYRNRSIKENLDLFKKMRAGLKKEGQACLRAKIDMASPFIVMRDPILYRIKFVEHHQTGNKWCIYPLYDFTQCISDALEGITHSLCTLEFQDNRRLYNWILNNIDIQNRPCQYEFSRLNLEFTLMSKRKLNKLVIGKYVDGWDDPRMPTISGLRRRGYTAASIRKFCKNIGVTKQNHTIKISYLESCVRDDLNFKAPRVLVVIDPIKLIIENYPKNKNEIIYMPNHPNIPEMGTRQVPFSSLIWIDRNDFCEKANNLHYKRLVLGQEVRLRYAYVVKAIYIERDSLGYVTTIYCKYDPNTLNKNPIDGRKVNGVIHWVSAIHAFPVEVHLYDHLFNIPNPEVVNDFISVLNQKSLIIKNGYAEPSLKNAVIGKVYQFERIGYFIFDKYNEISKHFIFNRTVSLRETWTK